MCLYVYLLYLLVDDKCPPVMSFCEGAVYIGKSLTLLGVTVGQLLLLVLGIAGVWLTMYC